MEGLTFRILWYLKDIVFRKIYNSKTLLMGSTLVCQLRGEVSSQKGRDTQSPLVVRGDGGLLFHFILSKFVVRGARYTFTTNKAYAFFPFTSRPRKGCFCLRRLKLVILVEWKRKQKAVNVITFFSRLSPRLTEMEWD